MIDFELSKGEIVLKAKDDTYLSSRAFLINEEANKMGRYEMQADERPTHERKLLSSVGYALSNMKAELHAFNPDDTLIEAKDKFSVSFNVSSRFQQERSTDLKRLTEEYIYRYVVADWWKANYPQMAKFYLNDVELALRNLFDCFLLGYPTGVTGDKYSYIKNGNTYNISIKADEALNAIHAEVIKVSKAKPTKDGRPDITFQTSEIEGEALLLRYMSQAAKRVAERLAAYLTSYGTTNEEYKRLFQYSITMPEKWMESIDQLCEEIHDFIVNAALAEWFKTVLPDYAAIFKDTAYEASANIKHSISVRIGGLKKPLQPF